VTTRPSVEAPVIERPSTTSSEDVAARFRVAITRLFRRLRQETLMGLSPAQVSALGSINRLGAPTFGELATVEQVQPPSVTRLINSLEEAGLVIRMSDVGDGRVSRVRLSPLGEKTLKKIRGMRNAYMAERIEALSSSEQARVRDLVELLEHLVDTA
jgi:DNA-binding MarR family transcriptional regulator